MPKAAPAPNATKLPSAPRITFGKYKGNPLIQFHKDDKNGDDRPFQFGKGKAKLLLGAMEETGAAKVTEMLKALLAMEGDDD